MKTNKNTAFWFGVFFVFLILITGNATADQAQGTETQITTNESSQIHPDIYGDKIVWQDNRNDNGSYTNSDIYMYDLSTSKETQITTNESWQSEPVIYGDKIVWQDNRNGGSLDESWQPAGNWDIYMYDLSTHKEIQITTNGSNQIHPDIYGDKIVWEDNRNGNRNIYMYDLSTSKETRITTNASEHYHPTIYGNTIAFERKIDEMFTKDIYIYDLSTSSETRVIKGESYGSYYSFPDIYGNRIVYMVEGGGDVVAMHDLSTSQDTGIAADAFSPDIYGDRIVYSGGGTGMPIRMYNISTSTETWINTSYAATDPAIYGNRIVWTGDHSGDNVNNDIYMFTISEEGQTLKPPVADFSAIPSSGKAPLKVTFTDKSTGTPTAWKWSFGDRSPLTTVQNPEHIYSTPGIYTVKQTVSNAAGKDTEIKTNYINVAAPLKAPIAAFSASPRSGKVSLKVQFADKSANSPTSWKWNFGDGKYSTTKSPAHTYSKTGKYNVSLTVKNAKGSNTKTISGYVVVSKK